MEKNENKKIKKLKKVKKTENTSEKVRRLPKFYVLDAVIILVIVCIALGMYFKYNLFEMFSQLEDKTDVRIEYKIENIKATTEYYISIGDKVYLKQDGTEIGSIIASSENSENALITAPATKTFTENGKSVTVNYPSDVLDPRINAQGNIQGKGVFTESGAFLLNGGIYFSPGQTYLVCTENVTVEITILDIVEILN